MSKPLDVLGNIRVASPCSQSWEAMEGDERARFCGACRLNVYNLSGMTRSDAEALIKEKEGRLCVRYYARPDGTVITQDCPVGLAAIRRRMTRWFGGIAAVFATAISFGVALGSLTLNRSKPSISESQPFARLIEWVTGKPAPSKTTGWIVMGSTGSAPDDSGHYSGHHKDF